MSGGEINFRAVNHRCHPWMIHILDISRGNLGILLAPFPPKIDGLTASLAVSTA
jgi:hypothetical protein